MQNDQLSTSTLVDSDSRLGRVIDHARVYSASNGYEFIETNELAGWQAVADWGRDGWDMGHWPSTIVMISNEDVHPRALVYESGEVEVREFDDDDDRTQFLNQTAEWQWRHGSAKGPSDTGAYELGNLPIQYYGAPRAVHEEAAEFLALSPAAPAAPGVRM